MRRWLWAIVLALVIAAMCIAWWPAKPSDSLFRGWEPRAKGKLWTITGSPRSSNYVFVDLNGAYQPRPNSYSIHYFIYDRDSHKLYSPLVRNLRVKRTLLQGNSVDPMIEWGDIATINGPSVVGSPGNACFSKVTVLNRTHTTRRLSLYAAALPYQITGGICYGYQVNYDKQSQSLLVDGKVLFSCEVIPNAVAAFGAEAESERSDITGYIRKGILPRADFASEGLSRTTSGAVRFDLTLSPNSTRDFRLSSPLTELSAAQWMQSQPKPAEATNQWSNRLGRVSLKLPDRKAEQCFRASLAYLIMLSNNGKPVPGPHKYRLFWVRDCAYMTDALYYAGQQDLIPPALRQLRKMQLPSGGFLPTSNAKKDNELDAPGEAIYALVQHYRRTGDLKHLTEAWPCITAACKYIQAKRSKGILPASVSAEDLGDRLEQHYWDDFWCIRGLRDASFAAHALGKPADATWASSEAKSLSSATRASIDATMARHSIDYIPNGPSEFASAAAARGTSCALWPCAVLDPTDPLTKSSFDIYWQKWLAPSNGGFVFRNHYWPYAGLDLAQGYLMLGQRERAWTILKWTLDHDPTNGFFAWPEGMFMNNLTLAEGDMPHGWTCAAIVSTVRNMLVQESGRDLILLSGVPKEWLKPGAVIAIQDFPTEFGKVSYQAIVTNNSMKLSLSGARPPGSYKISLPGSKIISLPSSSNETVIPLHANQPESKEPGLLPQPKLTTNN